MAKRRMGMIAFLFCLCLHIFPGQALAVNTADAIEPIIPDQNCSLVLSYSSDGTPFLDVPVKLYKVADVSSDARYTLTAPFASTGLDLNSIQSSGEWDVVRSTLEVRILVNKVEPLATAKSNTWGQVGFESLEPGMYLAISDDVVQNDATCSFDSALVALPGLGTDGLWQYNVVVAVKPAILPPIGPDEREEETEYKVLKLWKGDEGKTTRPKTLEVDIYKDGTLHETVTLSADNNWSYSWTTTEEGIKWAVSEKTVPMGYTATVEVRDTSFVLTNTLETTTPTPGNNTPSAETPKTGDTPHIMLYTVLMYVSGVVLVLLGLTGKRKRS